MPAPDIPELPASALPADAVLLDVREPDEWAAGHIESAVHIPIGQLTRRLGEIPAGNPLFVICRSGSRSARVAEFLRAQGTMAVNVAGGMQDWAASGKPMVSDTGGHPEVI
ncbi:MAG: rhodanese-like domain-containing protein [Actinomycetota bacterium]|nr:rhodanese-like domain-containing protein [Actinomycetota bacterium]